MRSQNIWTLITYLSSHTVQPHNLFECSEKYTRYTKGKTNKKAGRWSSSGWPLKAWRFFHSVALCFDNIQTGKYWVTIIFIGQKWNGSVFLNYIWSYAFLIINFKITFLLRTTWTNRYRSALLRGDFFVVSACKNCSKC